jgi:hypothetical protein
LYAEKEVRSLTLRALFGEIKLVTLGLLLQEWTMKASAAKRDAGERGITISSSSRTTFLFLLLSLNPYASSIPGLKKNAPV